MKGEISFSSQPQVAIRETVVFGIDTNKRQITHTLNSKTMQMKIQKN